MSHFSRIRTRFSNLEFLKKALADQRLAFEEGDLQIRGFAGQTTSVDLKIPTMAKGYDIGFRRQDDVYELVGDWYGLPNFDRNGFLLKTAQRYAYHAAVDTLKTQAFALAEEEVQADGTIRLVLRR